jgi:AcrR family transcriptional regulator
LKSKRQLQKENTKIKILKTAYKIYSEYGFTATTAMIAKEAGVSHGTIFVHFSSVNELLTCLIESFGYNLALEIHDLADKNDSIKKLLETHLNILSKHENFYIHLISEKSLIPEDVQMTLVNIQSNFAFHFNRIMEREIQSHAVKSIPVYMVFNTWIGLIHYYLLNKDLFSPDEPLLKRYSSELIATFLELIKD